MITVERHDKETYEILVVTGIPTIELLIKEFIVDFRTKAFTRKIWDFTNCPMDKIQVSDYNKIISVVKQYTGTSIQYRTAFVVKTEIEQILGETFEAMAMAANLPVEYGVFVTVADAVAWIEA